ncbi:MAG: hypothetical protein WC670_07945 [Pseudolabrys sp.]
MSADSVAEDDYQSFCEALGSSERGRAFLQEYARRNRHADTEVVLSALNRLEETALEQRPAPDADRIRQDLRALLDTLRSARPQTDNSPSAIKAATLAALIDFAQARIEALVTMPDGVRVLEALAAVPDPEQPELPIPHPVMAAPAIALVQAAPRQAEPMPAAKPANPQSGSHSGPAAARLRTTIPIVEFDYREQQINRGTVARPPAPVAAEESWTTLAPPAVAAPGPGPKVEPDAAPAAETTPAAETETYELWLDTTTAAGTTAACTMAPKLDVAVQDVIAPDVTAQDVTAQDLAAADAPASTPVQEAQPPRLQDAQPILVTGVAATAIEALVQQMQRAELPMAAPVAPVAIGKAEVTDPLAPIMALTEEERIALFT